MAKKKIDENVSALKQVLQSGKAIIGRDAVLKQMKAGKVKKIFMAKNIAPSLRDDLDYYANLGEVELVSLEQDNEEIGVLAKKNFFISVVGVAE